MHEQHRRAGVEHGEQEPDCDKTTLCCEENRALEHSLCPWRLGRDRGD